MIGLSPIFGSVPWSKCSTSLPAFSVAQISDILVGQSFKRYQNHSKVYTLTAIGPIGPAKAHRWVLFCIHAHCLAQHWTASNCISTWLAHVRLHPSGADQLGAADVVPVIWCSEPRWIEGGTFFQDEWKIMGFLFRGPIKCFKNRCNNLNTTYSTFCILAAFIRL